MRKTRMLLLACLALLAIGVAACGSETNDYRGEVSKIQEKYVADLQQQATTLSGSIQSDPTAAAASLDQLAATSTKLADEVAAVDAPDDKQALADQLVGAYRGLATAATDLKGAVQSGDMEALQKALEGLNQAQADEAEAITAFNNAE